MFILTIVEFFDKADINNIAGALTFKPHKIILVDELYKLSSVADRFGGPYVKKVLVCSDLAKYYNAPVIRARAEEMGIELIDNVKKLTLSEFSKKLYTLLGN